MSQLVKNIMLVLLVVFSFKVSAQDLLVDPEQDEQAMDLLLTFPGVEEEMLRVRKLNVNGATFSDYIVVTRATQLPAGLSSEHHFAAEQFFMFASSDVRYLCQVGINILWSKHGSQLMIEALDEKQQVETRCYPRL